MSSHQDKILRFFFIFLYFFLMNYNVYDVYYNENGRVGIAQMQGVDILSALKLFSQAYPERLIFMITYKFSFNA